MKEAIQSCGWRQLWHRARKRGKKKKGRKKNTNDARYEEWKKKREAKYVSLQTFLVCSYITLVFGRFGAATVESATFSAAALFLSFLALSLSSPSIAGIFFPEFRARCGGKLLRPPAVCGRLLCEQMRPRTTPCACAVARRRVLQADGHLWKTKAALWKDGHYLSAAEQRSTFEAGVKETRQTAVTTTSCSPIFLFRAVLIMWKSSSRAAMLNCDSAEEDLCWCLDVPPSTLKLCLVNSCWSFYCSCFSSWDVWGWSCCSWHHPGPKPDPPQPPPSTPHRLCPYPQWQQGLYCIDWW